jgi:hypothetical protein
VESCSATGRPVIDVLAPSLDGRLSGGLSTRARFWLPLTGEGRGKHGHGVSDQGAQRHAAQPTEDGAAGALGAAAATAITATRASAADGDPIILGQENFASSPTVIKQTQPGDTSSLAFGGGFLSAVSAEGPVVFGTLDLGEVPFGSQRILSLPPSQLPLL